LVVDADGLRCETRARPGSQADAGPWFEEKNIGGLRQFQPAAYGGPELVLSEEVFLFLEF
jgi:hypothetical protein